MRVSITKSIRGLALCVGVLMALAVACQPPKAPITEKDVDDAQKAWCKALVDIGKDPDPRGLASRLIDDLYDFKEGKVFFKPTQTFEPYTFRTTKEGALAYFVGGDPDFPDRGFALEPWTEVTYDNKAGVQIHGDIAITMGHVSLKSSTRQITVDKTFVFRRGSDGRLRLCVHHSSLPYVPPPPPPPGKAPAG